MKERNKTNRRKENKKYNILKKYIFFIYIYIKKIHMIAILYKKVLQLCKRKSHFYDKHVAYKTTYEIATKT